MKVTVKNFTEDIETSTYQITMASGKKYKKTMNGYLKQYWRYLGKPSSSLDVVKASSFEDCLAGKWESYKTDCGTTINSSHVESVKVLKTDSKIVHYISVEKESIFDTTVDFYNEKGEM